MSKKCLFDCKAQQKIKKWSKKCLFDCKAQQKIKKWSKTCFFFCKAQQKIKKLSKKCLFDCKAQQKTKKCQKSVPGGVFYPVVFFNSVHPVGVCHMDSCGDARNSISRNFSSKIALFRRARFPSPTSTTSMSDRGLARPCAGGGGLRLRRADD